MRILGEGVRELQDVAGIFSEYEGCPIALYGLGIQTEETITSLDRKFQIVGLMDSFRTDGVIYGKPIISLSEAAEKKIKLIIVVARPGSCRAIARNIGGFCVENHIKLFDVRGKDLCAQNNACYDLTNADGTTKRHCSVRTDLFPLHITSSALICLILLLCARCFFRQILLN